MLSICICEENQSHLNYNINILKKELNKRAITYHISQYSHLSEIQLLLSKATFCFDILFIDIHFEIGSSLALIKEIHHKYPSCRIIHLTNTLVSSSNVLDADFTYFIIKDIVEQNLPLALDRALEEFHEEDLFKVSIRGKTIVLKQSQILYFERDLRVTHIITTSHRYTFSMRLDEIVLLLNSNFIRCHRSYIININYIKEYSTNDMLMNNEYLIPISRRYQDMVKQYLFQNLK